MSKPENLNPPAELTESSPRSPRSFLQKHETALSVALPALGVIAIFEVLKKLPVNTKGSEIPEVLLAALATCMGGAVLAANRYARNQQENGNDQE
jgi:hypothetical protein